MVNAPTWDMQNSVKNWIYTSGLNEVKELVGRAVNLDCGYIIGCGCLRSGPHIITVGPLVAWLAGSRGRGGLLKFLDLLLAFLTALVPDRTTQYEPVRLIEATRTVVRIRSLSK